MTNSDNTVKPELLPCPFCGGDALMEKVTGDLYESIVCSSKDCILRLGVESCFVDKVAWNTRADSPKEKEE